MGGDYTDGRAACKRRSEKKLSQINAKGGTRKRCSGDAAGLEVFPANEGV
jgi:hypothetical protein